MFTGIVEKVGEVERLEPRGAGYRLRLRMNFAELALGESVAVDGACLTVVEHDPRGAAFDVSSETVERTALGALRPGARVNLERAMPANGRFSGHIVQGHVDGVGEIAAWSEENDGSRGLRVRLPESVARYCVEKGSLTVQGVSLTVNRVEGRDAEIRIVPHTWAHTSFSNLVVGGRVNLEADAIAKYVEKLLEKRI